MSSSANRGRPSPIMAMLQEIRMISRRSATPRRRRSTLPLMALFVAAVSAAFVFIFVSIYAAEIAKADEERVRVRALPTFRGKPYRLEHQTTNESVPFWAADLQAPFETLLHIEPKADIQMTITLEEKERIELSLSYGMMEKRMSYIGSEHWLSRFERGSRAWINSLATFEGSGSLGKDEIIRQHGWLGIDRSGKRMWNPSPQPVPVHSYPGGYEEGMKNGGFYLNLSDALPLDRRTYDNRGSVCSKVKYNYTSLPDASVIITYYNEPFSTLFRTVHSVLNYTPPPLLREIILVDDHSNLTENYQYIVEKYVKYLPKVKVMRLPERRGLVNARLAGAHAARGEVLTVLDSHVEVNEGWLEPQLARIAEQRNVIVFPQIFAINPETFTYDTGSGIGCHVSFRWSMQEQSSLTAQVTDPSATPSPSMAGGLFSVDREYFWYLGGYDEGFSMWGAENVEMGFRVWLCGGRLECTPCAMTYHIYRKKGHGYESPHDHITRNRLRTARLWTDEYYPIARTFITNKADADLGALDDMLELKERLQCRKFQWFLDNVDKENHDIVSPNSIMYSGEIRNRHPVRSHYCLDTMSMNHEGEAFGVFPCHGEGGTQSWVALRETPYIVTVSNDRLCLSSTLRFEKCRTHSKTMRFQVTSLGEDSGKNIVQIRSETDAKCLALTTHNKSELWFEECDTQALQQQWSFPVYHPDPVPPLVHTEDWLVKRHQFHNNIVS